MSITVSHWIVLNGRSQWSQHWEFAGPSKRSSESNTPVDCSLIFRLRITFATTFYVSGTYMYTWYNIHVHVHIELMASTIILLQCQYNSAANLIINILIYSFDYWIFSHVYEFLVWNSIKILITFLSRVPISCTQQQHVCFLISGSRFACLCYSSGVMETEFTQRCQRGYCWQHIFRLSQVGVLSIHM